MLPTLAGSPRASAWRPAGTRADDADIAVMGSPEAEIKAAAGLAAFQVQILALCKEEC